MALTRLQADSISNGAVSANNLANNSVTVGKVANGAVTVDKLASNAVTSDKLASTSVTSDKLASGAARANFGAGAVLQVVHVAKTSLFSTTSTTYVDVTGWAATITPSSSTSKILILADSYVNCPDTSTGGKLQRNGTDILLGDSSGSKTRSSFGAAWGGGSGGGGNAGSQWSISYLDSPGTTSALTYKIVVATFGASTLWIGGTYGTADANYAQVVPSTITLMEIAG